MRAALMLMALALAAGSAEAASKSAWDECGASDPERSIAGCTQVLADRQESRQNRALAHTNRGLARLNRGDVDQAIADFDEAIRLQPKQADAYNNRGNAYSRKRQWSRAIADYGAAIDLGPKSALAHYNRGLAYHTVGELDRAIADFEEAIRLDPKDPDAHNERGRAHHAKGEFDRAVADYGEAIRRDPRHMIAYFNRGLAHQAAGELDRAIADFGEAVRLAPESADIYGNRGIAHAAKGDLDRAVADYDEAIRRDPAYAAAYANRGLAHEAKGDTARAAADFRAALAAPAKDDEGSEAHRAARSRLEKLGTAAQVVAPAEAAPEPEKRTAAEKPPPIAPTHRRLALVIGNDAYQNLPPLRKAVADARAYAELLEEQGFDVRLHTDLTRGDMEAAVSAFVEQIAPGDMALFAYSGHGWSDGVQNYIVGVDLPKTGSPDLLARMSLPLRNGVTGILDDLDRRGAGLKVAIIDACRDNPFQSAVAGRSIGLGRGLARIDPPRGTFVVFSAGTGQVALDALSSGDPHPNSVFTRVFIPLLKAGLPLQEATQRARVEVVALARKVPHDQQPAYYDELLGEVCLAGACAPATATPPAVVPPPIPADEQAWARIAGTEDAAVLDAFAALFPQSARRAEAEARAKALREKLAALTPPEKPPVPGTEVPPMPVIGQPRLVLHHNSTLFAAVFTPDGRNIVTGSLDQGAGVWDAADGRLLRRLDGVGAVSSVAVSPDGRSIVAGSYDGTASLSDAASGRRIRILRGHADAVKAVAVSPDGQRIVTGSRDKTAAVWDAASGRLLRKLPHVAEVDAVAVSPDGRSIATASSDFAATIWDADSGRSLHRLEGHASWVGDVVYLPDGRTVLTGSSDGTVGVWDVATGRRLRSLGSRDATGVHALTISRLTDAPS